MTTTLTVILPIFMLLGLGWLLRLRRFPGNEFWRLLDPLVFYILLPALLVRNFANVDVKQLNVLLMRGAAEKVFKSLRVRRDIVDGRTPHHGG